MPLLIPVITILMLFMIAPCVINCLTHFVSAQANKLQNAVLSRLSRARLCEAPQTAAHQAPRPWESPGKNPGVGCHFLLQCMKVKSLSEVTQSYLTISDPMNCSLPGSSTHGIFQARVLEWGAMVLEKTLESLLDCKEIQLVHPKGNQF